MRLSEEKRSRILDLIEDGETTKAIAKAVGVSPRTVDALRERERGGGVDDVDEPDLDDDDEGEVVALERERIEHLELIAELVKENRRLTRLLKG